MLGVAPGRPVYDYDLLGSTALEGATLGSSVSFVERSEVGTDSDDDIPPICSAVPGNE